MPSGSALSSGAVEHRIGQQLNHLAAHFEKFFLGQATSFFVLKSRGALQGHAAKVKAHWKVYLGENVGGLTAAAWQA